MAETFSTFQAQLKASKILLVEDEKNLGLTLSERLQRDYHTVWSSSVKQAKETLCQSYFDLAILDVGLPDGDGFEVARYIRIHQPRCAVIFLSAFAGAEDRIRGLELGAEDYVVKPFHLKELMLRIQKVLKRVSIIQTPLNPKRQIGESEIDFLRFEAKNSYEKRALTHKEVSLLQLLLDRQGEVVSRDEILNAAWSEDEYPTPRTVDNFILRLRKLVERDPEDPQIIKTIRGIGYKMILPEENRSL